MIIMTDFESNAGEKVDALSFEQALSELELIVEQLEGGSVSWIGY